MNARLTLADVLFCIGIAVLVAVMTVSLKAAALMAVGILLVAATHRFVWGRRP